ncbi:MAG: S9 family peptidase [Deltaproteobacteria bacterium]|nr:S9 family peptidase [Deltaproteobacteria bacterium]
MPSKIPSQETPEKKMTYPLARVSDVVDDYHGEKVPDPYRWLEDSDSEEARAWIEGENRVTFGFLGEIPAREKIRKRMTKLWDFERYGVPMKEAGRYFFLKNSGLQNQSVLYTTPSLEGEARVLLDPNLLSPDGTVALTTYAASDDGKYLAYGLSSAGSDWNEFRVRDVETGVDRQDHLKWIKFSRPTWTKDGKGFFYGRYKEPEASATYEEANFFHKLYYHRLGTPQSQDELTYERPDHKDWMFGSEVTEDGRYLVITVVRSTEHKNLVFYKDLQGKKGSVVELISDWEAEFSLVGNDGPVFWFRTNLNAPRGRLIAIDVRSPARANWKEIIPEVKETLESLNAVGDQFLAVYLENAHSVVKVHGLDGKLLRVVRLPGLGTAAGFGGKRKDKETFYAFTGFTTPTTIYRYDVASGESTVVQRPTVDFRPEDYETRQVFYQSKDGTRVPMFISHKKGIQLDGSNPTYLYGYGGFNVSLTPWFDVRNLVWMEMGGVLAVPNLRGGGEYGEAWHEAGTKLRKQNVFDDFIAAAEWLVENRYTSSSKLAIGGGSNGGLLVGACMNQRPTLFAAALPAVGVMDMLRFHKFTIGWAWVSDYGSSDNAEEFKALYAYSPLHNIKKGVKYPATLITTADHDDRVVPGHSFKFAAALQAAQAGDAPVLIRIDVKAGHGAGKPTSKIIEEAVDRWGFLTRVLGM